MNILPFSRSQHVHTDSMAESEMQSSIPPWPVAPHRTASANDASLLYNAEIVRKLDQRFRLLCRAALAGVAGFALFVALV